jgi:hypothetical protein
MAYGAAGYVPAGYAPPASTNGLAVASLVLGLIGVLSCGYTFFVAPLLAVIFGVLGRRQIRETGQRGEGMAMAGLVLGIIGLVISALIVVVVIGAIVAGGGSASSS